MSRSKLKTLFFRIGGEEKLKEILRDFYCRMSKDILIGFFFSNHDPNKIADAQAQFLMFAMGVNKTYTGKNPSSAHLSLPPILKGHFDRRLVILEQTLKDHGLEEKDIQRWVQFENAFRKVTLSEKS